MYRSLIESAEYKYFATSNDISAITCKNRLVKQSSKLRRYQPIRCNSSTSGNHD